jgi:hypothetical protein
MGLLGDALGSDQVQKMLEGKFGRRLEEATASAKEQTAATQDLTKHTDKLCVAIHELILELRESRKQR